MSPLGTEMMNYAENAIATLKSVIDSGHPITSLQVTRSYGGEGTISITFGCRLRMRPATVCKAGDHALFGSPVRHSCSFSNRYDTNACEGRR